jgi:hypothetical protein
MPTDANAPKSHDAAAAARHLQIARTLIERATADLDEINRGVRGDLGVKLADLERVLAIVADELQQLDAM